MMNTGKQRFTIAAVIGTVLMTGFVHGSEVDSLIAKIQKVGAEGQGNVPAAKAARKLSGMGTEVLFDILAAIDEDQPIAANYLRSAFENIADKTLSSSAKLPAKKLESYVLNTKHSGISRRLAYEWLLRVDPGAEDRLIPGMLDDPGAELRRDAVARLLDKANSLFDDKPGKAKTVYQKALVHARDSDQVTEIAEQLEKLGQEIDLTKHFGYITHWWIIGPFDSSGGVGYAKTYPPEKEIDLFAFYTGKGGKQVRWRKHVTKKEKGLVDLNEVLGDIHGAVAYAYTVVESPKKQTVELRASSNNAVQLFLNGKKVYGREEYHHGVKMDQHVGEGVLKKGRNEILVKILQNEQTEAWAQRWDFQLRISDYLGTPVPVEVVLRKN